jgi:HK97 family phage portal protein
MIASLRRWLGQSETRSAPSLEALRALGEDMETVTPYAAENLATVQACVSVVSGTVASLPSYLYRRTPTGRIEDTAHPLARLIASGPNLRQSWPDFIEWLCASTMLSGNALAELQTDTNGAPVALIPIPWHTVNVMELPSGRIAYDVAETTKWPGTAGRIRRLFEDEVLHVRDRSDDGVIGRSRLSRAGRTVKSAISLNEHARALFENGIYPSGALQLDGKLAPEQLRALRAALEQNFQGPKKAARFLILDQGVKWQGISISPEDAELLASRKFAVEELCRVFNVPPPLVQDYARNTFTNAATAGRWFAQFTLSPLIRKIEAAFSRQVIGAADRATRFLEIDMSGLLRGDYEARWQAHKIAVDAGILTVNEVREVEGWNPIEAQPVAPGGAG